MRVVLRLKPTNEKCIALPQHYNHLVQSAIYSSISPSLSKFLHESGFLYGKRSFKLFTFSRLFGRYQLLGSKILFEDHIELWISSPIKKFIEDIANFILKRGYMMIGNDKLCVTEIIFPKEPNISQRVKIRMLSPVTVYSTLYTREGNKKTYYYSPYEKDFSRLINENAKKKFYVLEGKKLKSYMKISPIRVRECVSMYKRTVIKGWYGEFSLEGPITLIKCVYEAGLGAKNSQGFGMFEVI